MPVDGFADKSRRSCGIDEIHRHGCDAVDLRERIDSERAADDVHSLVHERVHDGEPDALARTRDDGDFVFELQVHR